MTAPRLNKNVLEKPPAALSLPRYQRDSDGHSSGIVHLGVGAFHRAHQALYTDSVLATGDQHWYITGASLRSSQAREQLAAQDYLYTVVERENQQQRYRLVAAIDSVIVASEKPQALIDAIAASQCKIVSLTITEKGYCHDPASGQLDLQHPDIQHDLKHPATPRSAPGFIVAALKQRHQAGLNGLSVLSCDNLPTNGQLTRQVVLDFAHQIEEKLAQWIEKEVSFPSAMVDRIVPATSEEDRQQVEQALGYRDEAMVVCEPFSQWVIEDNFIQGRPAWEKAGATFVDKVHNFETMKLRLLNGSHSTLAYLGFLAGYQTIDEVMADPHFTSLITYLMDCEITPTLEAPPQIDLGDYKAQLRQRFCNSSLKHQTRQIAMDGSQKLPQRLIRPLQQQLQQQGSIDGLCLAIAAWIRYTAGVDEAGTTYSVADPLAQKLQQLHQQSAPTAQSAMDNLLGIREVFPAELCDEKLFVETCTYYLDSLLKKGSINTVVAFNHNIIGKKSSGE
jgi:fructuronate reductase